MLIYMIIKKSKLLVVMGCDKYRWIFNIATKAQRKTWCLRAFAAN